MSRLSQRMKLPDGRILGYDEYGRPDGRPIFHFHGVPSSRREWPLFGSEALAQALGVRVIVPDRPGIGLSSFQPGRRIIDWPADVAALADHLGLERFAVLSYSAGGPYAAACALAIPERLTRAGLVSSPGPFDQPGLMDAIHPENRRFWDLVRGRPWLAGLMLGSMGLMARYAGDRMMSSALATFPEPDHRIVAGSREIQRDFLGSLQETLRQGTRGALRDSSLIVSPWGFRLQDIQTPVRLWHGEADRNAPAAMGRYLAEAIPSSRLQLYPDEGHVSLVVKNIEAILRFMADGDEG